MRAFRKPWVYFVLATGYAPCILADDYNVSLGVFAQSNFAAHNPSNEVNRMDTYLGVAKENNRNATYLPGNTIIYNTEEVTSKRGGSTNDTIRGVTQSGIPVIVPRSALSRTNFDVDKDSGDNKYHDVVVHRAFGACPHRGCRASEQIRVGEGTEGFHIEENNWRDGDDDNVDVTLVSRNGARLKFSRLDLLNKEADGILTIHKGRSYPRFQVFEGYAGLLSKGCGDAPMNGRILTFPSEEVSRVGCKPFNKKDPETWTLTSKQWDRKAIEIFKWGPFDAIGDITLTDGLPQSNDTAVDITVFALLDSEKELDSKEDRLRFGVLLSLIHCEKTRTSSRLRMSYVRNAIYESESTGEIELPQQLTSDQKREIFKKSGGRRSFMYSLNSSQDFHNFFEKMSDSVGNHHLAAFLISRLNATCRSDRRDACSMFSNYPDNLKLK